MRSFTYNLAKTVAFSSLFFSASALALPTLQLGIEGGTYNFGASTNDCDTETTCASSTAFTLYALVDADKVSITNNGSGFSEQSFRVSAAVAPALSDGDTTDYGSFDFDGTAVDVTADMTFGSPPLDDLDASGLISPHGIFDTYFRSICRNGIGSTRL